MTKYAAFLRGILPMNPNMRNEKLRSVATDLGFENVESVISSGNLIFEAPSSNTREMEDLFERAWPEKLGFESTTIIRSEADIQALIDSNPFGDRTHGPKTYLLTTFSKDPLEIPFEMPYTPPDRDYLVVGAALREIFTVTDTASQSTPDVMAWLEKQFGKEISSRTWLTVHKIRKRMRG